MNVSRLIQDKDFCEIVSDKFTATEQVKRGHIVWVVGHRALPIDETDPYTQRIHFFVHLVEDGHIKADKGVFLMDPKSIQKVGKLKQKKLEKIMKEDFKAPEFKDTDVSID